MKEKEYVIDRYIVILKLFGNNERKPSEYAQVKLEFILSNDTTRSIHAYADFYEVRFNSYQEFVEFFNIKNTGLLESSLKTFQEYLQNIYLPRKLYKKMINNLEFY